VLSKLKKVQWRTAPFNILMPLLAMVGLPLYIVHSGVHFLEPLLLVIFLYAIAFVVSSGYHRYFAHKAYACHPVLKAFYLIVGCAAFQQSALVWSADHRMHHRFTDTDKDPYSMSKGFWWAHMGWIFAEDPKYRRDIFAEVPDLAKDRMVMWQHKYWMVIGTVLAFGIPLAIGFAIGRPLGMLLWAGVLRVVLTLQTTFTINSIAHYFGTQPYSDSNSARDCWWLAPILFGENYHNYHHSFQADYRNGIRWYQWDPSKWMLWLMSHTFLVRHLRRTPEHLIVRARLEMEMKRLESKLLKSRPEIWASIQLKVQGLRNSLEEAAEHYAKAYKVYLDFKEGLAQRSRDSYASAKQAVRQKRKELQALMKEWQLTLRPLNPTP